MRLKGISLPVNAVVIIALAIMVLLFLAMFFGAGSTQMGQANLNNAWNAGCRTLRDAYKCDADSVPNVDTGQDVTGDKNSDDLLTVCRLYFNDNTLSKYYCRNKCCGTVVTEGTGCEQDRDCQFGLARGDWKCNPAVEGKPDPACCPSGESWNETAHSCQ